jgi:hypothetical protein
MEAIGKGAVRRGVKLCVCESVHCTVRMGSKKKMCSVSLSEGGEKGEGRIGPLIETVHQNAIREERAIHVATHTLWT